MRAIGWRGKLSFLTDRRAAREAKAFSQVALAQSRKGKSEISLVLLNPSNKVFLEEYSFLTYLVRR